MKASNQQYPTRNSSAIKTWTNIGLATSVLLLVEDALLYAMPTSWDLIFPWTCMAPLIALGVLTSVVLCSVMMFQKATPGWNKWLTMIALVLGLVSLVLYIGWFPYVSAYCQSNGGGCN